MHFILSYDLTASDDRRPVIREQIEEILSAGEFYRCLGSVYLVHIDNSEDWNTILQRLTNLDRSLETETLRFIMNPPASNGFYNGLLSSNDWQNINRLAR